MDQRVVPIRNTASNATALKRAAGSTLESQVPNEDDPRFSDI